jgi:hypothetical protein
MSFHTTLRRLYDIINTSSSSSTFSNNGQNSISADLLEPVVASEVTNGSSSDDYLI